MCCWVAFLLTTVVKKSGFVSYCLVLNVLKSHTNLTCEWWTNEYFSCVVTKSHVKSNRFYFKENRTMDRDHLNSVSSKNFSELIVYMIIVTGLNTASRYRVFFFFSLIIRLKQKYPLNSRSHLTTDLHQQRSNSPVISSESTSHVSTHHLAAAPWGEIHNWRHFSCAEP